MPEAVDGTPHLLMAIPEGDDRCVTYPGYRVPEPYVEPTVPPLRVSLPQAIGVGLAWLTAWLIGCAVVYTVGEWVLGLARLALGV